MLLLHWQFDSYINGFPQYADDVHVLNNVDRGKVPLI